MNSFPSDPNEPLTPQDRALEALLLEHACHPADQDDEAFLTAFEARLARESVTSAESSPQVAKKASPTPARKPMLWACAAALVAGAAALQWQTSHSTQKQDLAQVTAPYGDTAVGLAKDLPQIAEVAASGPDKLNQWASQPGAVRSGGFKEGSGKLELSKEQAPSSSQPLMALSDASASVLGGKSPATPMSPVTRTAGYDMNRPADDFITAAPAAKSKPESITRGDISKKLGNQQAPIPVTATGSTTMSAYIVAGGRPNSEADVPARARFQQVEKKLSEIAARETLRRSDLPALDSVSDSSRYKAAALNDFIPVLKEALSTFSIDVDTASYANIRRMILSGQHVPAAAVRVEEMLNYFPYQYEPPQQGKPFSVQVESTQCPWAAEHRLVKVALMAKDIDRSQRKAANLVFLIDVSGSMQGEDRLELVLKNLRLLTAQLSPDDTVAIVTYAGSEGLVLPPTSGADKATIMAKLDALNAGGSTNGGAGIKLAYKTAHQRLLKDGINRVVLCTDGDFNVGVTGDSELIDIVKQQATEGVFLTVCGYGQGNLNDAMLEGITNKGNGIYHYIDSEREGRKVFQDELFGTLVTVAKDVKLQLEFNPAHAQSYRLIGYDNRMLAKEDFANDKVDAGDIGAGHRVTALYEVVPVGAAKAEPIPLKYQQAEAKAPAAPAPTSPELLTVKLRYKEPTATSSQLLELPFTENKAAAPSADLRFAATVAEFGERLRGHTREGRSLEQLIETAEATRGTDPHGYRAEFIEMMRRWKQ